MKDFDFSVIKDKKFVDILRKYHQKNIDFNRNIREKARDNGIKFKESFYNKVPLSFDDFYESLKEISCKKSNLSFSQRNAILIVAKIAYKNMKEKDE